MVLEKLDAPVGEQDSEHAAHEREEHAFGKHLADEPQPPSDS